jgi:protein-L-isoaspartate(D-aspartate) O-methyltransferase
LELCLLCRPSPLGANRILPAPHLHAICLELLYPFLERSERALEITTGCGYFTTLLSECVKGYTYSLESDPVFRKIATKNIQKHYPEHLDSGRTIIRDFENGSA